MKTIFTKNIHRFLQKLQHRVLDFRVAFVPWMTYLTFNIYCVCKLSHFSHIQLFAILCIVAHQAPLSMGFSRQEYWFSSVQSFSRVRLFVTPWIAACQASLSITNSRSLLKLMSIELVMPSNHLILCCPFLLLPSIFPSIRVFSNE